MTDDTSKPRKVVAEGHRIPDDQWDQVVRDAEEFAKQTARAMEDDDGPARGLVARRLTPVTNWTAQGIASQKYFPVSGLPTQLIVLHSMECPLANGYAHSVTKWALPSLAAGGPEASWHRSYGPDARVYFIPDELGAWHASEANPLSIGLEQTGYASYTRAQWTTPDGLRMLDTVAYDVAAICKRDGIPPVMLSTAQVRAVLDSGNRSIKGICYHRQIDPETRTDPGNGYPADLVVAGVKKYLGTTPPTKDWFDMATLQNLKDAVMAGWAYKGTGSKDAWQILRDAAAGASAAKTSADAAKTAADKATAATVALQKSVDALTAAVKAATNNPPATPPA